MMIPTLFGAKRATITGHSWPSALVSIVAGLLLFGLVGVPQNLAQLPSASFEVASIKPNRSGDLRMMISSEPGRYTVTGVTTKLLIEHAYGVKDFQSRGDQAGSARTDTMLTRKWKTRSSRNCRNFLPTRGGSNRGQ